MDAVHGMGKYWILYSQTPNLQKIIFPEFNRKFLTVNVCSVNDCSVKLWKRTSVCERMCDWKIFTELEIFYKYGNFWIICRTVNNYAL